MWFSTGASDQQRTEFTALLRPPVAALRAAAAQGDRAAEFDAVAAASGSRQQQS